MKKLLLLAIFAVSVCLWADEKPQDESEEPKKQTRTEIMDGQISFVLPKGFKQAISKQDKDSDGYLMTSYCDKPNLSLQLRVFPTGKPATVQSIRDQIIPSFIPSFMTPRKLPDQRVKIAGLSGTLMEVRSERKLLRLFIVLFGEGKNYYWISLSGEAERRELQDIYQAFVESVVIKRVVKKEEDSEKK